MNHSSSPGLSLSASATVTDSLVHLSGSPVWPLVGDEKGRYHQVMDSHSLSNDTHLSSSVDELIVMS